MPKQFKDECEKLGWTYSTTDSIVRVHKTFTPGDLDAYSKCDSEAYHLLSMVTLRGGSIWGTDGGSIGGHVGLTSGYYTLNKSGYTGKRFIKALNKL